MGCIFLTHLLCRFQILLILFTARQEFAQAKTSKLWFGGGGKFSVEDYIFTLNPPISTSEVSMFKLAIEVCFENHFGLIRAIFLSLRSSKSVYFFGTPGILGSKALASLALQHLAPEQFFQTISEYPT